ncbi:hypothetical protein ACFY0A_41685 [Streptomyces sp. NPDC001698]|uniref:hypothetical protein n=1 Tax=Streptomyces sp. NPDC001698 TaxID=3364601 RepID=UPI0036A77A6A
MTPAGLRRIGKTRLAGWLANRSVRNAPVIAAAAVEAAHAQHTQVPGEKTAAAMTRILARVVMNLNAEITRVDALIEERFHQHQRAEAIVSMPTLPPQPSTSRTR